jgi:CheY-like chemotaxis protein
MKKLLVVEDHVFYRTILSKLLVEYELAIHASLSEVPQPLDCYDVILTDGNHGE